jgi:hypothetical protein
VFSADEVQAFIPAISPTTTGMPNAKQYITG